MPIYALILVMALAGGSVSAAASNALPGDALYPVKVKFNEEVRSAFTLGAEAKAQYDEERAIDRLKEAETLAAKGDLQDNVKAQVKANFDAQTQRVEDRIAAFKAKENFAPATDVAANFETALEAHQAILAKLAEKDTSKSSVTDLAAIVKVKADAVTTSRTDVQAKLLLASGSGNDGGRALTERWRKNAIDRIRDGQQFIVHHRTELDENISAKATYELRVALRDVEAGEKLVVAGNFTKAAGLFQQASHLAHRVMLLLEAQTKIGTAGTNVKFDIQTSATNEDGTSLDTPDTSKDGGLKTSGGANTSIKVETNTEIKGANTGSSVSGSGSVGSGVQVKPVLPPVKTPTPVLPQAKPLNLDANVKNAINGVTGAKVGL